MRQQKTIYFVAGIISLLLSYWMSVREFAINPDAICYLLSAKNIPNGLSYATQLCEQAKWPFYSILIFFMASLTKLSLQNSAYVLNSLFSLISVLTFITLVRFLISSSSLSLSLKNTPRILWLAAAVILSAHEFNAVREYIIRDHGFWSFYLLSLLFLLYYFRKFEWRFALAWSVSLLIATAFRIESAFFLLAIPVITLFYPFSSYKLRIKSFLKLNLITLCLLVLLGCWMVVHKQTNLEHLGRLDEIRFQIWVGARVVIQHFNMTANNIASQFLNPYAASNAGLILFFVLIILYFINLVPNLTLVYSVLVIYAWTKKLLQLESSQKWVLWSYIFVNFVVTAVFLVENMFLSKRYLIALSLILMLWVPFALDYLCAQWQQRRWPILTALFLMIVFAVGGIFDFGYSKKYIHDAGLWLEKNVPTNATLYSNDYQVMYYSGHFGNDIFIKAREFIASNNAIDSGKWKQYDYIALRFNKKNSDTMIIITKNFGMPVQRFSNRRGDEVSIYKIH